MSIRLHQSLGVALLVAASSYGATPLPWQDNDLPHVKKEHVVDVASPRHQYTVRMGGTVDMDHAMTRHNGKWQIGWQPNESLTIANMGTTTIENAKVIVNDRGDWYTIDNLLRAAIASAKTDQEKVYLIWEFSRSNRHHDDPIFGSHFPDEMHDPVKMLMGLGSGLCDDAGSFGSSLFYTAGFREPKPFVRCLHGHMMCEVFAEKRWQFMDIDEGAFYLDRENDLPVGGDVVVRDHDLAHRELHYGPLFSGWSTSQSCAALFGRDDGRTEILVQGHQIRVTLRPGERMEYRWDNVGKWAREEEGYGRRFVGNSKVIYEPPLGSTRFGASEAKNVSLVSSDGRITAAGDNAEGELVYMMTSPFIFCGGRVTADFHLRDAADRAVIEAWSTDRTKPVNVWESAGPGEKRADVEIDKAIGPTKGPPKYAFGVRIRLMSKSAKGAAVLRNVSLCGEVMVSPIALPRLRLGENAVVYADDSKGDRKVRLTYRWRETTATQPLSAPIMSYPPDGQTLRDDIVTYKWQPVPGAVAYHLRVSRDPAMRWPYRPGLDVVYKGTEFAVPFWGIYSPDTTYHWQVRTQNDKGIWGDWTKVQTFRWAGPRVPVAAKLTQGDGVFTLSWQPNPHGERPVTYEVYGSDIKGFSIAKEPHEVATLGKVPGNYLGRTAATHMIVGGSAAIEQAPPDIERRENLNRCYYRIVAVDRHGTHSGCSDYAEMPHPFIWTKPVTTARAGVTYRYEPKAIRDMGDLQHRYEQPENKFWEQEMLSFTLAEGPKWLAVDPKTGVLTGTPPADGAGKHAIRLRVTATFEPRTGADKFTKDLPSRQGDQVFDLVVSSS